MRFIRSLAVASVGLIGAISCEPAGPALPAAGPNALEVTVASTPPGASLVVDGAAVGVAPVTLKLNPGPHRAHASMNGYYPAPEARFQVGADQPRSVSIALMASH
jgi:hypothetical protein